MCAMALAVEFHAGQMLLSFDPHIGMHPTFAEPGRTVEAHIFDFDRDIYGAKVRLEIVERTRGERKFESGHALATQVAEDLKRAKQILATT